MDYLFCAGSFDEGTVQLFGRNQHRKTIAVSSRVNSGRSFGSQHQAENTKKIKTKKNTLK